VVNKIDEPAAQENLARFVEETGLDPIAISCASREGLETFMARLREIVQPETRFHHTHAAAPDLKDMPDTTGDEIPAEALKFATFLKLEKPKAKSHPSRGNIH
jgi:50S ribosomal subunit-associated GTPase HflX